MLKPFITYLLSFFLCAFSLVESQTMWTKYSGNPVLNVGPQPWDSTWVFYPEVFFDGAIYRMWYTGYDESALQIGYATSVDRTTWTKLSNPVLSGGPPGSWDEGVIDASVTYDGTTYHMWYRGEDGINTRIGYATSADGVIWGKADSVNPVLDIGIPGSWDDVWVMHPTVIFDGTTYHMWYMGWGGNIPQIGYATSPNGYNWHKYDDPSTVNPPFAESDPVMSPGPPGSWDAAGVLSPCVIYNGTTYQMWYVGGDSLSPGTPFPVGGKIGYATSSDGITWSKADSINPVLEVGLPGAWDGIGIGDPDVIFDGNTYHMYYDGSGWDGNFRFRIGYATDSSMVDIDGNVQNNLIREFELSQNYPNPFNPSTTIEFDLPRTGEVSLKIFNILGEEVATLLSASLLSGSYSVNWDASVYASGVYLYRLQAGEYIETRKMVLMQ
jgi:predicted GH43/DUF377 family glycosyl hydrolase